MLAVLHKEFVGLGFDKLLGGCLALALLAAGQVAAQDAGAGYPSRTVRVIVPAAAGGGADITARLFGQQLGKSLGQTFVVDNRPGASNIIGTEIVARAQPDGYTLLLGTTGPLAMNPLLYAKLPYDSVFSSVPHIRAGRLRPLAISALKRSGAIPDVPTLSESGLDGFEAGSWYGFLAPARTPREIVTKLHGEIIKALKLPEVQERLASLGTEPIGSSPAEFATQIRNDLAKWGKVVQAAGIQAE